MVLSQTYEIHSDSVGEGRLVKHLSQGDIHGLQPTIGAVADVTEGIEAKRNSGYGGFFWWQR